MFQLMVEERLELTVTNTTTITTINTIKKETNNITNTIKTREETLKREEEYTRLQTK